MNKVDYCWHGRSSSDNASGSWGSSEDFDSPRSFAADQELRTKGAWLMHSQVLRIKEEDLHLGEDVSKVVWTTRHDTLGRACALLTVRPVLPCSRLGGHVHSR